MSGRYHYNKSDLSGIDEAYTLYAEDVRRHIYKFFTGRQNASYIVDDLSQDTWLRVFKAYPNLDEDWNVRSWILKIATNISIDYMRLMKRRTFNEMELLPEYDYDTLTVSDKDPQETYLAKEEVENTYKRMRPDDVLVVHLHANGFSNADIQRILGKGKPSSMKMTIFRSRGRFKRIHGYVNHS